MQVSINTDKVSNDIPVISIISAVYNVADYLPAYLESLDAQSVDRAKFEVILVSDGSPDNSESLISDWLRTSEVNARLLRKENGGQASARNLGLTEARGEWVTFCDPDDFLAPDYLAEVFDNMSSNAANPPAMYATRLVSYLEESNTYSHNHPLKRRFRDGTRVVDLNRSPDFFHMHGPTAIVKRTVAEAMSLRFAEELRFSFEDAHYVATYLLAQPVPTIGYVDTAVYNYRVRAARNSSVQIGATKPEKYTDVLQHGHLDLIEQCHERGIRVPKWLQFMMLYDVLWYFRGDRKIGAPSKNLPPDVLDTFHAHMSAILAEIDPESIGDFEIMPTDSDLRNALILGYQQTRYRPRYVNIVEHDEARQMTRLEYLYSGELPDEEITYRGRIVQPALAKSQAIRMMGRNLFYRRHIWIPSSGTFSIQIDGSMVPLEFGRRPRSIYTIRPVQVERYFGVSKSTNLKAVRGQNSKSRLKRSLGLAEYYLRNGLGKARTFLPERRTETQRLQAFVQSPANTARFSRSWVLMDRVEAANDNAEHLYRYILTSRPHINAWFVLDRNSSDWARLESEGFRLLEFGSRQHYAALVHASVYASSHLDRFITNPLPQGLGVKPKWKFVFLQHGVTLHDQSAWFNSKKIDLLLTATNDEFKSIVADNTAYKLTSKEVSLTGFPRHDALVRGDRIRIDGQAKLLVLSPTWRAGLLTVADSKGHRELLPEFESSTYSRALREVVSSPEYVDRMRTAGYEIAYLPHPSMEAATAQLGIDPRVRLLNWKDQTFAQIMAQADVWVTDYSSTAFEAGYAGVPVVYYQFDRSEVHSGLHIYDSGYFSFEEDGFGPVVENAEQLLTAVESIGDEAVMGKYEQRLAQTFPHRDSGNSARAYRAIQSILKRTAPGKLLEK